MMDRGVYLSSPVPIKYFLRHVKREGRWESSGWNELVQFRRARGFVVGGSEIRKALSLGDTRRAENPLLYHQSRPQWTLGVTPSVGLGQDHSS